MIAEIITNAGEVISSNDEIFYDIILKNLPDEKIKDYFLKKEILTMKLSSIFQTK